MELQDFLTLSVFGNSIERILMAGALFVGIFLVLKVFQVVVLLKRSS